MPSSKLETERLAYITGELVNLTLYARVADTQ